MDNSQQQQQPHRFPAVASSGALPEMDEPSPSDAPDLLNVAYEYVKAQEESGFGDPLIGDNCENFDILQYIGGSDTPEEAFCGAPSSYHAHHPHSLHHPPHQQQHLHHPLLGANTTSELVQALQSQGPLQKDCGGGGIFGHPHAAHHQLAGLSMYNGGGTVAAVHPGITSLVTAGAVVGGQLANDQTTAAVMGRAGGQTRLPDSPPITDISGGASSISPGSSGGGCDSASPFSPDQFQYVHSQMGNAAPGAIFVHPQRHPTMDLANQMHLMGTGNGQQQQQRGGRIMARGGNGNCGAVGMDAPVHLCSPNSADFLSPYPPSQSTPGSQHSSQCSQVSPPAIPQQHQQGRPLNYLLHTQPPHPALSVAGSFSSMDNLTTVYTDAMNGNGANMEQLVGVQQQHFQQQHHDDMQGRKRRRMSSSAAAPGSQHEFHPLNSSSNLPNIKSEVGAAAHQHQPQQRQTNFGAQQQQRSRPLREASVDSQHQQQNMLLQTQQQQQSLEDLDENSNVQRTIKFEAFLREYWATLYDANQQPLPPMPIVVVADKGFNFSPSDGCFVNQKKNHFQITVNIAINPTAAGSPTSSAVQLSLGGAQPATPDPFTPRYVRLPGSQELLPILNQEFTLSFCGVKSEMPTCEIKIKQSQTDRKPIDHEPVRFLIDGSAAAVKQTVPRLHFSETTLNNHRKNGKPNPEQKYFLLVVKLMVNTPSRQVLVQAYQSDRVIVRASNPGQFEQQDSEQGWKLQNGALTCGGPVCIGGDKPVGDAHLTVNGNVVCTGQFTRPSDRRVKEDIAELSTTEAMSRVAQMRLVEYAYKPEMAQRWGLSEQDRHRVGVIAQELADVLPDAVRDNGEFLTVDDTRIFYDTVAAAQELYRLTGNLECKIGQVEKISQKLARHTLNRKMANGSMLSGLSGFTSFLGNGGSGGATNSAAFENKSCVSYSRTSLASTGTTNNNEEEEEEPPERDGRKRGGGKQPSKRGGYHRCRAYSSASAYCNRSAIYCRGPESTMCNSKFTQGTIVTLVVIMALCLMAMCTLYVLDWYNRTYVFPSHFHHFPGQFAHPDATQMPMPPDRPPPMNIIDQWNSSWTPPIQNVPPLSIFCASASLASIVAGPFAPSCPQYCCAQENTYYERLGERISQGVDSLVSLVAKFPNLLPKPPPGSMSIPQQFGNGVKIELLNLNATLDSRYCLLADENCSNDGGGVCMPSSCNRRNGRFDLYIPVSPHLPTMPLQLRISVDDPTLVVEDCGSLPGFKHCLFEKEMHPVEEEAKRNLPRPRSYQVNENVFEMTAGSFLQSAYKFRVGHSTQMCEQDEKQRGRTFDEFNLIFYRTCAVQEQPKVKAAGETVEEKNAPETTTTAAPAEAKMP